MKQRLTLLLTALAAAALTAPPARAEPPEAGSQVLGPSLMPMPQAPGFPSYEEFNAPGLYIAGQGVPYLNTQFPGSGEQNTGNIDGNQLFRGGGKGGSGGN